MLNYQRVSLCLSSITTKASRHPLGSHTAPHKGWDICLSPTAAHGGFLKFGIPNSWMAYSGKYY